MGEFVIWNYLCLFGGLWEFDEVREGKETCKIQKREIVTFLTPTFFSCWNSSVFKPGVLGVGASGAIMGVLGARVGEGERGLSETFHKVEEEKTQTPKSKTPSNEKTKV